MARMSISLLVASAFAALAFAGPGSAASIADPDDVGGSLDLRSVSGTLSGSKLLTVTITTWESWSKSTLPSTGSPNRLLALFDVDSDGTADYRARIVSSGGALVALVTGKGQSYEPVPVRRPNAKTARFRFPADIFLLNARVDIAARSVYKGGSCASACKDRAPDSGWLTVTAP